MKKFWKLSVPVFLALLFILTPAASVPAEVFFPSAPDVVNEGAGSDHVWPVPPEVASESALIMEISTSSILYEKAADEKRYPASTTKILTALIAIENCSLDELVTFSENAVTLEEAATNIKAQAGEQMPLKDVLYGLMLASGNDCANAIAEHVAGSISAFADMMNERAAKIGCTGSHFSNPHGLFAEDHYTTARDLALIAQEAFKNSTFVEIMSEEVYYAAPTNMDENTKKFSTWNLLLDPESEYHDPDVIGGKTGFLDEAGRCLVTFASRNGFTVITVQLKGAYTGIFDEAKQLLDYTFDSFSMKNISSKERRFSGAVAEAKVVLDPSAQVLTLNAVPFDQLESTLIFADELTVEQKAELQLSAGTEGGRSLYAVIDYAYAGHALGSVNVYLDSQLELAPAAFTQVYYISPLALIVFIAIVLLLLLIFYGSNKTKKTGRKTRGRPVPAASRAGRRQEKDRPAHRFQ